MKLEKGQGPWLWSKDILSSGPSHLAASQLSGPGQSSLTSVSLTCQCSAPIPKVGWRSAAPPVGSEGASQRGAFDKMLFLLMWEPFESRHPRLLHELQLD